MSTLQRRELTAVVAIAGCLDSASTVLGLSRGAQEANPVMRSLIEAVGPIPAMAVRGLVLGVGVSLLLAWCTTHGPTVLRYGAVGMMVGTATLWLLVVIHNLMLISRAA